MAIHSSGQIICSFTHILGEGEVDEIFGGGSGMSKDRIGEVDDDASEG